MTCEKTIELISASIDEMLEPAEQERLDAHLAGCANCRAELEQLRQAVSLLHEVEPVAVPPGLEARIVKAVREPAKRPLSWNVFNYPQARVALAAGIVVVLSVFVMQTMKPPPVESPPRDLSDNSNGRVEEVEERAEASPAADDAVAVEPAPPALEEERQSGGFLPRKRARSAPSDADIPAPESLEREAPKKRSDAIWQEEAPAVREGLRVGDATPLPAAESVRAAPRPTVVPPAAGAMRERGAREEMERGAIDAIPGVRVPAAGEGTAEHKAKAAPRRELEAEVDADNETEQAAFARTNGRYRMGTAPAAAADGVGLSERKDLRGGRQNAALSFTVTGIGEERALALLIASPREKKRDNGEALKAARSLRDEDSDSESQPVVTRLADGRISIVAMVQSADLPGLLAALGREGTVQQTTRQDQPSKGGGVVRVEFVLVP